MAADVSFEGSISPIPMTGCFMWTGAVTTLGYGRYWPVGQNGARGKVKYAHRHAAELRHGPLEPGVCVLHSCDTPSCVNPDHLFLGSKKDNTRDMMSKGRDRFVGERNPRHKLSDAQVVEIRNSNISGCKLAKALGVSRATVTAIRRGETRVISTPLEQS